MIDILRAPFPYFGGKTKVAPVVWERFGSVDNYVEPFCGSAAMLLARPGGPHGAETINDLDGRVANTWRAIKYCPEKVADELDWPLMETDYHARRDWVLKHRQEMKAKLEQDPRWCSPRLAAYFIYAQCCAIGKDANTPGTQLPQVGNGGRAIFSQHAGDLGVWMQTLATRLRKVRVICGKWPRICTPVVSTHFCNDTTTAIFLDPPYSGHEWAYREKSKQTVADHVWTWAQQAGQLQHVRIAVCGYQDDRELPAGWTVHHWTGTKGYGKQGGKAQSNRQQECIWFSPHCRSEKNKAAWYEKT